jgi:DNA-binding transcriptional LysR family regulator
MNELMQERELVGGMSVFVAVVEGGSFAAAAKKTRLTPSAVSKLVTRLERGLGARLVRRTTRSMTVTAAGQTFYERSRALLSELRGVEQEISGQHAKAQGLVRVSAPLLLGQTRVVPILLAFQQRYPAVSLDLDLTDRAADLVGEHVDVAVRITATPPPSFVGRHVGAIRRVLCASPAYLRSRGAPKTTRDLAKHDSLLLAGAAPHWSLAGASGAPPETVRVEPRLRASSTLSLYEAAKAGLGIAELPHYLVQSDLRARRLTRVLDVLEAPTLGVYVIYPATPLLPGRVRELVKHLVRALQSALGQAQGDSVSEPSSSATS